MDRREIDAVFVREQSSGIYRGSLRPFGNADAPSPQILRLRDAAAVADVNRGMAKNPGRKNWQRDKATVVLRNQRDDFGKRDFGDVELRVHDEAIEHFLHGQSQDSEVDTFDRNRTVLQVAHVVVLADRERERNPGHDRKAAGQSTLIATVFTTAPY